jgi:hypothetical protein
LREAVDASANFKVDPVIVNVLHEVVFINEVLRDVGELDFDVFRTIQRGAEIEVGDVEGAELGAFTGENTVNNELDKFKGSSFGANIAWVADSVAGYRDSGAVRISFLWANFADNIAVANFFETFGRNVSEVNDMEGICAVHRWLGGVRAFVSLAETSKFFSIGRAPDVFVLGMFDELTVFKRFSSLMVEDCCGNEGIDGCVGTSGLGGIGEHDKVDFGFGITGFG